jgi:hypothetical protein
MTTKDELKRFRELGRVSYERYMMFLDKLKDKKKITPPDVMEHVGLLPAEIRTIRTRELIKAIQERMRLRKLVGDVY